MSTTVYFIVNSTDTGTEITEPTREESHLYCTTEAFPGLDQCPFPQQPLQTHFPQPGERLMLIRPALGANFATAGNCDDASGNFPSDFWAGWFFLAFPPTGGRPGRGALFDPQTPGTPFVRGDKIVVTGFNPGDTTTCTQSFEGVDRHFKRFQGEKQ